MKVIRGGSNLMSASFGIARASATLSSWWVMRLYSSMVRKTWAGCRDP
jgi:hypothetical protein